MVSKHISFKHTNGHSDAHLEVYATEKLASLDKFTGGATDVRSEVEFEKMVSHKSGPICRAEVNVFVDGSVYRSEATEMTFEAALDVAKDELAHEMSRAREKRASLIKRGGRKLKELLRFGK